MSQDLWTAVDRYVTDLLIEPVPAVTDGLPPHEVSPPQGMLLELLARAAGAERILEIGTLGGYSTIFLARSGAQRDHARARPRVRRAARARTSRGPASRAVEVIAGPALDTLATLTGPLRPRVHRRRQAQQPRVPALGAASCRAPAR